MTSAVGYIRVSSQSQVDEGISLDAQRDKIRAFCELHDLKLLEIFRDEGISGKRADNRPGLQMALKLTCVQKATLVCYSLSRLARSLSDCISISQKIQKCGASMACVVERFDTSSASGEFFFHVVAALAQMERRQISERTKSSLDHKRRNGQRTSRFPPYGYDFEGSNLIVKPSEQIVLGHVINRRKSGDRVCQIVKDLNEAGLSTKYGKVWTIKNLFALLETVNSSAPRVVSLEPRSDPCSCASPDN